MEPDACEGCDERGWLWVGGCTCGAGPGGYYGMHEFGCGYEPCPCDKWKQARDDL